MSFFSWLWVSGMTMTVRIAQRVADQREADAGVAGGALDDGAAGLQRAACDRVADDERARRGP